MRSNKTCALVEQYLSYPIVIKGQSYTTIFEYRTNLLMFFMFILTARNTPITDNNFAVIDLGFIKSITLNDMYAFIAHYQTSQKASSGTRARELVSIRQFWKYLSLKESVRLLLECKKFPRDHCTNVILTIIGKGNKERRIFPTPAALSTHKLRHTAATLMYKYALFKKYQDMKVLLLHRFIPILMNTNYNLRSILIHLQ